MSFTNGTLSGLTDSDGSFGINISKKGAVTTTWSFDQSFEKPFLDYMCSVLNVGRVERKFKSGSGFSGSEDAWRFKVDSLQDSIILNQYFNNYPLYTQKASTRYTHWKQVLEWQLQGPSTVKANLPTIK